VDAIAATAGPGLIGGVMVGLLIGKGLALSAGKPLIAVNHLEGHALSPRLVDKRLEFPYLLLLASGGHCQLLEVRGVGDYRRLATTIDDAAGEAFDKVGRLLGLPYPGGPAISAAAEGARAATRFPRARTAGRYDFSFSGLKTAVLREVAGYRERGEPIPVDGLAAAFEEAVVDALVTKTVAAAEEHAAAAVALGGGVAANRSLRAVLRQRLDAIGVPLFVPPPAWCTDNGAMIGAAGGFRLAAGDRAGADLEAIPNLALPWLDA
jgi:N6-L-threonylcarbamoyladenine synthase